MCNTLSGGTCFLNGIQMDQWTEEFICLLQNDQAIDVLQDVGIPVKGEKTAGNISVIWLVVQIGSKYLMFDSRCHEMTSFLIA